jgi:4-hydroxybenzoate polyprenyltransferase
MRLALLRATHPEPAAAVTVVSGLLALAVGHGIGGAALVTATVAASQLAVGWANDALDADRDAAVGRTDKPVAAGAVGRRTVAVAAVLAAAATVLLALGFGPRPAVAATVGLVSAMAYNWPLKRTVLSPLPYAVSFAALPAFVVLALPATPPVWLVAAGGLLGAGAHFANVLPDLADDAVTGVHGLAHRLGATGTALAAAAFLLAATGVLVLGPPGPPSWVGLAALAGAVVVLPAGWYAERAATGAGRRTPALFRAFLVVALVNVGLLLASGTVL